MDAAVPLALVLVQWDWAPKHVQAVAQMRCWGSAAFKSACQHLVALLHVHKPACL